MLIPSKDESIWSKNEYDNFVLDLEFKNAEGTNSGVIVHATDIKEWIPHSVEIQIADDYSEEWSKAPANWQCAAIFGHQPATKHIVKKAGEWNHYTITCIKRKIWVVLNGELIDPVHYFFNDLSPLEYEKVLAIASVENQSLGN